MTRRFGSERRDGGVSTPDQPLDGLLDDVRDLRLTLAADLHAAAGAAEAGAADVAREIVDADQRELARFARVAEQRLHRLTRRAEREQNRRRWRRRLTVTLPAVPLAGAMAIAAAAATGSLPVPGHDSEPRQVRPIAAAPSVAPVNSQFRHFVSLVDGDPSASQVIAAAAKLHRQLRHLIATSPSDPERAAAVAQLLRLEQSLLMTQRPPGANVVLTATRKLAARLITVAPELTPTVAPTQVISIAPTHRPHRPGTATTTKPTSSPKPSSSPSPSPSPSAKASSSSSSQPSSGGWPSVPAVPH